MNLRQLTRAKSLVGKKMRGVDSESDSGSLTGSEGVGRTGSGKCGGGASRGGKRRKLTAMGNPDMSHEKDEKVKPP